MSEKKAVIEAVESEEMTSIEAILMNESVEEVFDATDMMSDNEVNRFFMKVSQFASEIVETISNLCDDDEDDDNDVRQNDVNKLSEEVKKLKKISGIVWKFIETSKGRPEGLFDTVQVLHDILIPLDEDIPGALAVKLSIARICENWWVHKLDGAENLVTQLIPYLLIVSLNPSAHDADVKRLYNIRSALQLLDFDDISIDSIRSLILRCFIHPAFLRVAEGRRFLSFLFRLHTGLNTMIFEVMKPQIAIGLRGVGAAYGEVLLKVWKDAPAQGVEVEGDTLVSMQSIEEGLQSLFHDAIHAAEQKYFKGLRIVLGVFHDAKRLKEVDSLLLRIYGPILWRSLRCANALVRAQATMLFFDAFPLQDSDISAVESDTILQKQFDLLSSLLKDTDHRVRAAAASGVCHILREYWEALPAQTTRQILTYVVGTLGHDSSCATVRLAVISGLGEVLDQPLAHPVLKGLLPLVANALHDKSQAVRVAFIGVLNKVKNTRGLHFCHIVSVEQLQRRLADDADRSVVCSGMTQLMLNSYYPQAAAAGLGPGEGPGANNNQNQVQRCLQLTLENVGASVAFYGTFYKFTSTGSASKMMIMLFALFTKQNYFEDYMESVTQSRASAVSAPALPPVSRKGKRDRANSSSSVPSNEGDIRDLDTFDCPLAGGAFKVAVLKVMLSCLRSISKNLSKADHTPSRDLLLKYFTPQSIQQVFTSLCSCSMPLSDAEEEAICDISAEAVPLFLQIVTIVWRLKGEEEGGTRTHGGGEGGVSDSGLTAGVLLKEFQNTCTQFLPSAASHARTTVEILFALGMEDFLIQSIEKPFECLQQSIQDGSLSSFNPHEASPSPSPELLIPLTDNKGRKGAKKSKDSSSNPHPDPQPSDDSTALSLAAAVELLAVISSGDVRLRPLEEDSRARVDGVFSIVRDVVDVTCSPDADDIGSVLYIDEEGDGGGMDKLLIRCVNLLAIHSLQFAFDASESEESPPSIPSTTPVEKLLSWVTATILPLTTHPDRTTGSGPRNNTGGSSSSSNGSDTKVIFMTKMIEAVLVVMSDALVMGVAVMEVSSALIKILDTLCDQSNENTQVNEVLTPVVVRMLNILSQPSSGILSESDRKNEENFKKYLTLLTTSDKENSAIENINIPEDQVSLVDNDFQRLEV